MGRYRHELNARSSLRRLLQFVSQRISRNSEPFGDLMLPLPTRLRWLLAIATVLCMLTVQCPDNTVNADDSTQITHNLKIDKGGTVTTIDTPTKYSFALPSNSSGIVIGKVGTAYPVCRPGDPNCSLRTKPTQSSTQTQLISPTHYAYRVPPAPLITRPYRPCLQPSGSQNCGTCNSACRCQICQCWRN